MKDVTLHIHEFKSNLGRIRTCVENNSLIMITLPSESGYFFESFIEEQFPDAIISSPDKLNRKAEIQIKDFFDGKRKKFSIPIKIIGTDFQKKVLKQVSLIPYGTTMSYGEIASAVGHPRAARAVGTVNAKNRLPFLIPCHRVVASNSIGGYGGGEELKRKLLQMEGAI